MSQDRSKMSKRGLGLSDTKQSCERQREEGVGGRKEG
jgi:hypothetical protein